MIAPTIPADEDSRVEALRSLCILDVPPEERFDRITRLARELLGVPICLISLVDRDRQWFKSRQGLDATETPRAISFCAHAILEPGPMVVEDAVRDARFVDNPLVTGPLNIRFYAGQPVRAPGGERVGTLCIIDRVPRSLTVEQRRQLADFAALVESEFRMIRIAELQGRVEEAQEELRKFFSLSLDLLCIAGPDGHFRKLNPAWARVLGYSIEELSGRPFIEFVHPEDRARTVAEAQRLGRGGITVEFENRYRCKDGSYRILHWSTTGDPASGTLFAAARDVTRLRHAQEELRMAREEAEAASLAKSRFLANMSHEFRTPLNSVIGFSTLLLEGGTIPQEQQRKFIERILGSGRNLLTLVNEILDLSKIEAGKMPLVVEAVSLGDLVADLIGNLEVQAREKDVELRAEIPANLAPLRTDPQRLRQVLTNLVANAVKFTEAGAVGVRVAASADGVAERIEIVDTGPGIPEPLQERIFDAFDQGDRTHLPRPGGTGLGLAIARSLCDLLGYRITLRSEVGRGSCFTIHLRPWDEGRPS